MLGLVGAAATAAQMRARDMPTDEIVRMLRTSYDMAAILAWRTALGWSQRAAAAAWCERFPDDPKTFKAFSYWESAADPIRYRPSDRVLVRLAALYGCDSTDLATA